MRVRVHLHTSWPVRDPQRAQHLQASPSAVNVPSLLAPDCTCIGRGFVDSRRQPNGIGYLQEFSSSGQVCVVPHAMRLFRVIYVYIALAFHKATQWCRLMPPSQQSPQTLDTPYPRLVIVVYAEINLWVFLCPVAGCVDLRGAVSKRYEARSRHASAGRGAGKQIAAPLLPSL